MNDPSDYVNAEPSPEDQAAAEIRAEVVEALRQRGFSRPPLGTFYRSHREWDAKIADLEMLLRDIIAIGGERR